MARHTERCTTKQGQARISGLYAVLARGSTVPCDRRQTSNFPGQSYE